MVSPVGIWAGGYLGGGSGGGTPTYPSTWFVNPDWEVLPTPSANEFFGLFLVFEDGYNRAVINFNSGLTIDWGDGSSASTTGSAQSHIFDYSTLSGSVNVCPWSNRNYKQVIIEVSGGTITSMNLSNTTLQPTNVQCGWADIYANMPSCATARIGTTSLNAKMAFTERVRITDLATNCNVNNLLQYIRSLRYLELPWGKLGSAILTMFGTGTELVLGDIVCSATFSNGAIRDSGISQIGNFTATNSFGTSMFQESTIRKIGTVTIPASVTNIQNMFDTCTRLISPIVIDAAGVTGLRSVAESCSAPSLTVLDASGATVTSNIVTGANMCDGVMLNGITIGFSINGTNCTSQGAYDTMDALGTASGLQTIDCRNTPFATDYAATDALALSAYALGVVKGFSLTMA